MEAEGRGALEAMRSMLDSLETVEAPAVSPLPGWESIEELVLRHSQAFGPVELLLDPTLDQVSEDGVALTAYRVIQEALANVARHAPGAAVTVAVQAREDDTEVIVEDDGRIPVAVGAPAGSGGGLGLVGMRERVTLAGGRLEAEPREGGGFRVRAVLPRGQDAR